MTPEERAEKICDGFKGTAIGLTVLRHDIAAAIRAASEKAFDEGLENRKDVEAEKVAVAEWTEVYRQEAKAEAYEDAAKIAKYWGGEVTAAAIRARAAEVTA